MAGMFSSPKIPAPPPPTPMADEAAIARAKKRASQRVVAKSGRAGTILSGALGADEKLGG